MINLKKSTDLTERQQNLINELEKEFINMNQTRSEDTSSLFAHVILKQDAEIEQKISEDRAKEKFVIDENLHLFYEEAKLLCKDFDKLDIPFEIVDPDKHLSAGKIIVGDKYLPNSFEITFIKNWENRNVHSHGYSVCLPGWRYQLYGNNNNVYFSIDKFINDNYFISRVLQIYKECHQTNL
jgi:hypothetical protein